MAERSWARRTLFLSNSDHGILARAETHWVFIDLTKGRPIPIPKELRTAFEIVGSEQEILREVGRASRTPDREE